ncbi:MAG: toll/interleukin-1 receptor domain-containing protein [Acidimicrobiales bacterium]
MVEDAGGEPIKVVISYRRDDASGHAGHLYADLVRQFGEDRVFIDIDNIPPGVDFAEVITSAIGSADVLIALIGRGWLNETDKQGRRKIDKPGDFVRLELESAIKKKLRILPVLVQDAEMPSAEDLPGSLATFARRNAFEISDKRWTDDIAELIQVLDEIAAAKAERTGARPAGRPVVPPEDDQAKRARELAALQQAEAARREQEARMAQTQPVVPAPPPPPPEPPIGWRPQGPAPYPSPSPPPVSPRSDGSKGPLIAAIAVAAVVVVGLLVALVAVSGGGGDGDSTVDTSPGPDVITETVTVRSDVPWNDTGIDIEDGQTLEIVASGRVATAKGSPSRDSEPDGKPGEEFGNNVIPGVKHGALIGMIGNGEPFEVGAYRAGVIEGSGRLYLGVNDKGIENNDGSYTATITVYW